MAAFFKYFECRSDNGSLFLGLVSENEREEIAEDSESKEFEEIPTSGVDIGLVQVETLEIEEFADI